MLKQSIIFISLFILSVLIIVLLNDDVENDALFASTLHTTSSVDTTSDITINTVHFTDIDSDLSQEKISELMEYKVKVIETSNLTDTVEIHTVNFYDELTENATIKIINNEISITSELGPTTTFSSPSFIVNAQFDNDFFASVPFSVYVIYIPEGMSYNFE